MPPLIRATTRHAADNAANKVWLEFASLCAGDWADQFLLYDHALEISDKTHCGQVINRC